MQLGHKRLHKAEALLTNVRIITNIHMGIEEVREIPIWKIYYLTSWWRGTVVECRSLTGELSPSCARPAADG